MKNLLIILFLTFLFSQGIFGQEIENPKLAAARALMNDYRDASMFESSRPGLIEPSWESIFKDCFETQNIIFDIPINASADTTDDGNLNLSKKNPLVEEYLKFVSIETYIQLIRTIYADYSIDKIEYQYLETGVDTTKLSTDSIVVFEIEKRFSNTNWSKNLSQKYLFTVAIHNKQAKISSIRLSDPGQSKNEVILTNVNKEEIITKIRIDFEENVYDRNLTVKFDTAGELNLGLISNRAKIFIDSAYGINNKKYRVPDDWKKDGKKVNDGAFEVALEPYKWNGNAFSLFIEGGGIMQSTNNIAQFSDDSEFKNNTGYSFGAGFTITNYRKPEKLIQNEKKPIFGVGTGISMHYTRFHISSANFNQNPYAFSDRSSDTCLVHYSGSAFEETISTLMFKIPVFVSMRKMFGKEFLGMKSFSLQAGVNFMVPFQSRYETSGTFSRFGEYPQYNGQIITEDNFYNYYTNRENEYNDIVEYKAFMTEGIIKLNGFFPLNRKESDNTLIFGLQCSFPFTRSSSSKTGNYLINTGNDSYNSLAFSKEKIYDYYFGVTVGFNFIKYKLN